MTRHSECTPYCPRPISRLTYLSECAQSAREKGKTQPQRSVTPGWYVLWANLRQIFFGALGRFAVLALRLAAKAKQRKAILDASLTTNRAKTGESTANQNIRCSSSAESNSHQLSVIPSSSSHTDNGRSHHRVTMARL